ncbi:MAG: hypothetical protein A3K19_29455 [Lentisphaerae bacterium RIFOXYB12_FULL_65_16]|nr:MAG: hypothetical protein A3K18_33250 [Lentisphaerae bacterium RIFOXYA12_64_32]OGV88283.1 MAG: hypothetical protein A3K19_29455 [Lentisphaerae bacterium RIFOXYB12_FULL_65_16]
MLSVPSLVVTATAMLLVSAAANAAPAELFLDDLIRIEPQTVPQGQTVELHVPALPARTGRATVLRFRAVIVNPTEGGCNYNLGVLLNGALLGGRTAGGDVRLLGRASSLELSAQRNLGFPVLNGDRVMIMFAPSVGKGDPMSTDGLGATFALDISDVARGVDGNVISFRNLLPQALPGSNGDLRVDDIALGWLDRATLPPPPNAVPERSGVNRAVTRTMRVLGDVDIPAQDRMLTLAQSDRGGFVIAMAGGPELLVETGLGMTPSAPTCLVADDSAAAAADVRIAVAPWGCCGFHLTATWPDLLLTRTVSLEDGLVSWRERWTNTGAAIRSVPFRHRVFLRHGRTRFCVGGWDADGTLGGSAANPTLFLEAPIASGGAASNGPGFGLTAESDWVRLLLGLRANAGVGEMFSDTLVLAPGTAVDFDFTVTPVAGGGYWSFINDVRARWGVNGITQKFPIFWGCALPAGNGTLDEKYAKALGHLGPACVVLGPWQRLEPDARAVTAGKYPKLPTDAARAPGACPDLDVDAFLTFAHRQPYLDNLRAAVAAIHRVAPQVRVMQMLHPSMETVYRPLQTRWPFAAEAILTPDGKPFESAGYSRSWLHDMAARDWAVQYYVPRPGSAYLRYVLDEARQALDELGLDGLYSDEFSWAYNSRGYSRYDYGRWDGYSADIDESGTVLRLKSDNAVVTESCQLQVIHLLLDRGKFFLNNGGNALRSVGSLPHARFIEGGNGVSMMGQGHLSPTPLILGNLGDEKSLKGVFQSVKVCLAQGSVYSPMSVNLLLDGPDNVVCKLYPLTVRELGPGWIVGKERLITMVSRTFRWQGQDTTLRLLRYDANGTGTGPAATVPVTEGQDVTLDVPAGGLLIAERVPGAGAALTPK